MQYLWAHRPNKLTVCNRIRRAWIRSRKLGYKISRQKARLKSKQTKSEVQRQTMLYNVTILMWQFFGRSVIILVLFYLWCIAGKQLMVFGTTLYLPNNGSILPNTRLCAPLLILTTAYLRNKNYLITLHSCVYNLKRWRQESMNATRVAVIVVNVLVFSRWFDFNIAFCHRILPVKLFKAQAYLH